MIHLNLIGLHESPVPSMITPSRKKRNISTDLIQISKVC
jgi:hypothetical protein